MPLAPKRALGLSLVLHEFGTNLIDRNIAHEFGGEVKRAFRRKGVACTMTLPLPEVTSGS